LLAAGGRQKSALIVARGRRLDATAPIIASLLYFATRALFVAVPATHILQLLETGVRQIEAKTDVTSSKEAKMTKLRLKTTKCAKNHALKNREILSNIHLFLKTGSY
jgi:hypothetical protein